MTNAELAAAVAKALDLEDVPTLDPKCPRVWISGDGNPSLRPDGSNLFSPYWRCRCLDWLHANGWYVALLPHNRHEAAKGDEQIAIICPASEFPARAVAKLMESSMGPVVPSPG